MKHQIVSLFLVLFPLSLFSQSFNTGEIMKPGSMSVGINPVVIDNAPGVYIHGGYGIDKKIDFNFKYGVLEGMDYLGADMEWRLQKTNKRDVSLMAGVHSESHIGVDIGLIASFRISSNAYLITGADADFNFNLNNDRFFWLPIGVEICLSKKASLLFEGDIPLTDFAPGIFGGGLIYYFEKSSRRGFR